MSFTNIDDPSAFFQIALYNGQSGTQFDVTNDGNSDLQPDFIWFKDRGTTYAHYLVDSSRGRAKGLHTNDETAESTTASAGNDLVSFNSDGFRVGAPSEGNSTNGGTTAKVAWQWKANGGTTASNSNGNIASTVQANTTSGFSIVTWTGDGSTSGKNVGHGLGAVPEMIISKDRDGTSNLPGWYIYHKDIGAEDHIQFTTSAKADSPTWGDTTPTSSVFSVGGEGAYIATNQNNIDYIAYCFAEKQGYSAFGSYIGSGARSSAPFIYTGFKPRFLISKNVTAAGGWSMWDTKRNPFNGDTDYLVANATDAESNSGFGLNDPFYFYSNGFGVMNADGWSNTVNQTYIYIAFAENPFVSSGGIPTTAF